MESLHADLLLQDPDLLLEVCVVVNLLSYNTFKSFAALSNYLSLKILRASFENSLLAIDNEDVAGSPHLIAELGFMRFS